jgi:hypothetical protein
MLDFKEKNREKNMKEMVNVLDELELNFFWSFLLIGHPL